MNKNSPLLVTGAAGFIGARIVESCNQKNIPLISVDRLSAFSDRKEHANLDFQKKIDLELLFDELENNTPAIQAVIHMGACSDTTERDPRVFQKLNLEYSQKLWNYCVSHQIPFIYASSAATYGDGTLGFDDDESQMKNLKPLNLYGQSKLDFDLWALDEEKKKNTPLAWCGLKFFNVYGYGEGHKKHMASLVFKAFQQIKEKNEVILFKSHKEGIADGMQSRDFVFVDDIVQQIFFSLENVKRGIFNAGSGNARSFLDLARSVFQSLKIKEKIIWLDTPKELREQYQYYTKANMNKVQALGYSHPSTSLETGVAQTIARLLRN